ncbi:TPA: hypothetical protein ACUAGH_004725, partial [Escherichia coli]
SGNIGANPQTGNKVAAGTVQSVIGVTFIYE